jgi:hypothetical protein
MGNDRFAIARRTYAARAAVLLGIVWLLAAPASAETRLTVVSGDVEIGRGEPPAWRRARVGDALAPGDQVRTGGGGRAEVELGAGVARLYENSLLRLPADGGPTALGLEQGGSLFDVAPRPASDPFEVRTPEVVAGVKGTRFAVLVADTGAAVNVYEGLVGVRRRSLESAREVLVREGFGAVGHGPGGSFELRLLPAGDPWHGWKDGAPAPAMPAALGATSRVEEARSAAHRALDRELGVELPSPEPPAAVAQATAEAVPASLDDTAQATKPERVPLDPGVSGDQALPTEIRVQVAESLLNGTAPAVQAELPAAAPPPDLLSVELVTSGGPNHVVITGPTGTLADLDVDTVETILDTGDTSLLGVEVLDTLEEVGVDATTFTEQLLGLLH